MKKRNRHASWLVVIVCVWGISGRARAAAAGHQALFTRDAEYEEYLHVYSNPDENKITPIRVVRWMMGMRGQNIKPHTATEFQPVFDADQHRVRAVATVAYKFF
jgi:hypothetical protein